jgi:hypothetical protein
VTSVVVAGALAQRPGRGGHAWALLNYILGFRSLGWDVLFVDRLDAGMCHDAAGAPAPIERSIELRWLAEVMRRFGLDGDWAVLHDGDALGLSRRHVLARAERAAFVVNVMGYLDDEDVLAAASSRVFLDIDPGFPQMWHSLGLADPFAGHDAFVTIGENVGTPSCSIPTCGLAWITTPQPVVLDEWLPAPIGSGPMTTVASWRGPYGPVEYDGVTYGLRVHEFRRFLELPSRVGLACEVALDIDGGDEADVAALRSGGWRLVDPVEAAGDPWRYRDYIRRSSGEFMVAKNMYVRSHSGWFSDRSICYLASGRPVLAQDTGFGSRYPTGEGLIAFSTMDEATGGAEEIAADPRRHSAAARAVAEEHFDSRRVLGRLLDRLGVS